MGHGAKLGRKAEALIAALLTEATQEAAAVKAGVSVRTAANWLRLPEFVAAYRTARRQVVEQAVARLQQAGADAVAALVRNLTAKRASARTRAADLILSYATKGIELIDLAERVEALETVARAKSGRR
jgi:hypothetical protein